MTRRRVLALVLALVALFMGLQGGYIHAKAWLAQVLLERAWRASGDEGQGAKPWPWADTWPVARLQLPGSGEKLIVLAGASGRSLAFAPGYLQGTARPGEPGVCLVAGHRDTHFADLGDVQPGEVVEIEDRRRRVFRYQVTETAVVRADAPGEVLRGDGSELVLLTCWPLKGVRADPDLRFMVRCRLQAEPG